MIPMPHKVYLFLYSYSKALESSSIGLVNWSFGKVNLSVLVGIQNRAECDNVAAHVSI